ncbi:961_t:CDS:1, partial [Racocetra fulgida]
DVLEDTLEDVLENKSTIIFDSSSSSETEFAQFWSVYSSSLGSKCEAALLI